MDANRFLETVIDSEKWFDKARALRSSAEVLYNSALEMFEQIAFDEDSPEEESLARAYMITSQMLYGQALEAALKASLVQHSPEKVRLEIVADGKGYAQEVKLNFKEVNGGWIGGHDLVGLARANDALKKDGHLEKNLLFLSERVRWSARYPTPSKSGLDEDYQYQRHMPMSHFFDGFREVIDPLLDEYLSE